jgi:hypothetical protein
MEATTIIENDWDTPDFVKNKKGHTIVSTECRHDRDTEQTRKLVGKNEQITWEK